MFCFVVFSFQENSLQSKTGLHCCHLCTKFYNKGLSSIPRCHSSIGAAKLFSILVQVNFKLLFSVDWDCMTRAGRNNDNEVHLEKPLCNIEFKDYIIESPPDATTTFRDRAHLFITSKISSDHEDPCLVSYFFKLIFWSD